MAPHYSAVLCHFTKAIYAAYCRNYSPLDRNGHVNSIQMKYFTFSTFIELNIMKTISIRSNVNTFQLAVKALSGSLSRLVTIRYIGNKQ